MTDAEIIPLGSHGRAGRGSGSSPSAAARGLAAERQTRRRRAAREPAPEPEPVEDQTTFEPEEPDPTVRPLRSAPAGVGQEDADAGASEEPPPEDPVGSLGGIVAELAGALAATLDALRSGEPLRQLAGDPIRVLLAVADRLGVDWQLPAQEVLDFARLRLRGDYAVDEFGFDPEFTTRIFLPLLRPLVRDWFRVEVRGVENLPTEGSALLVCNHAGTLPLDGMVLHACVYDEIGRHVRMLGADLIFATPFAGDLARRTGTTLACQEDAERLLAADQLVAVFPEGFKGLGKPYADRYKLQRFGRGGFVSAAVRASVPIVPVSIVGSEEIYPLISGLPSLARALGVPYFPVTPLFPWLGLLGLVPLPSKWIIEFGELVATDELPPGAADDPMVVFEVTDQVRETIQHTLYKLLVQRRSVFF